MQLISRTTIILLSLSLSTIHQTAIAQSPLNRLELGFHAGTLVYQGDLTPERLGAYKTPGWQLAASVTAPVNHFLSVRANLLYGKMRADDEKYTHPEWRQHRNLKFNTRVLEFAGLAVWDVFGNSPHRAGLSPYILGGLGLSLVKVRRDASGFDADYFATGSPVLTGLNEDMDHDLPRTVFVLPFGAGVRYPLTDRLSLNAEGAYRITFNDYLDGFSRSGNPERKDNYHTISIGVFYKLGDNSVACPPVKQ